MAPIAFETLSGILSAERDGDRIAIELPSRPVVPCPTPRRLLEAIGVKPRAVGETTPGKSHGNLLVELADEATVRSLKPRFDELRQIPAGVIVTARADHEPYDFVSRYFAAPYGIDEDPVTGSAHCSLAPYWATKLGRRRSSHGRHRSAAASCTSPCAAIACGSQGTRSPYCGGSLRYRDQGWGIGA